MPRFRPPQRLTEASPAKRKRRQLEELNDWVEAQGLPRGVLAFDFADPDTGEQKARVRPGLAAGVAGGAEPAGRRAAERGCGRIAIASQAGFRCFASAAEFQRYVRAEVLVENASA